MERLICLVVGYCFGLIQTSYIIGRIKGIDIRKKGSGNAGTTNSIRVMGWKFGLITMACDIMKCIVPVLIMRAVYASTGSALLLGLWTAAGVVLGHDFPFYLKFKGGKGIAATAGTIIAFADWHLIVAGIICFFVPVLLSRFVSLGSLCLSLSFLVGVIISGQLGVYDMAQNALIEMYILVAVLTALAFWLHRSNIVRLATGTERKLF